MKQKYRQIMAQNIERNRKLSEVNEKLLAENENRLEEQKKRTIYVALPGKLSRVSDSVIKALHPDILHVNRISHGGFLVFSSEAVRDKAFPVIQKAHIQNSALNVDYCGEKSKAKPSKPKSFFDTKGLNLSQLVVSDLPVGTTMSMLEIVFPKANDIKIIKQRHIAYVNFNDESDALEAFKKGKGLKVSSIPVVVRYRFTDLDKKANGSENKEPIASAGDVLPAKKTDSKRKAKADKQEIEVAKKAKKALESGEIKPMLSKKELEKAVPLVDSDLSSDEDMVSDEELMELDDAEDGVEDEFEDSDEDQTFDAELITENGKTQISSLKSKPIDKKAEAKSKVSAKELTKVKKTQDASLKSKPVDKKAESKLKAKEPTKADNKSKKKPLVESSDEDDSDVSNFDGLMEDGFEEFSGEDGSEFEDESDDE